MIYEPETHSHAKLLNKLDLQIKKVYHGSAAFYMSEQKII